MSSIQEILEIFNYSKTPSSSHYPEFSIFTPPYQPHRKLLKVNFKLKLLELKTRCIWNAVYLNSGFFGDDFYIKQIYEGGAQKLKIFCSVLIFVKRLIFENDEYVKKC